MSVWPGAMFAVGYGLAFGIVALAAPDRRFRMWALCTMAGSLIGGAAGFGLTLLLGGHA